MSKTTSARLVAGRRRAKAGSWQCRAPIGYVAVTNKAGVRKLVPDDETAGLVKDFFAAYAHGGVSVAEALEASGLGAKITREGARHVLRNEAYLGVTRYGSGKCEKAHRPLVSRKLWELAQAKLKDRG